MFTKSYQIIKVLHTVDHVKIAKACSELLAVWVCRRFGPFFSTHEVGLGHKKCQKTYFMRSFRTKNMWV